MDPADRLGAMDLGSLLRGWRMAARLTQRELADMSGISLATVRDLEQQRTRYPHPASLRALAASLDLTEQQKEVLYSAVQAKPDSAPDRDASDVLDVSGTEITVDILGPLRVRRAGRPTELTRGRQRVLLARLALSVNLPVSQFELVELLWGSNAPETAINQLHKHISRLRGLLGSSLLSLSAGGYQLNLTDQQTDLGRFRVLVRQARQLAATDPFGCFEMLTTALRTWRDDPLAEVAEVSHHSALTALIEERIDTVLWCAGLAQTDEQHRRCLPLLRELATRHPLHEPIFGGLIDALAATGQTAAALNAYDEIRTRLVEELGIDPGPRLRAKHLRVLRHQHQAPDTRADDPQALATHRPAQLPAPPRYFTGRGGQLGELNDLLSAGLDDNCPVIATIVGPAGVGKTALALRWAAAVRARFPDGQLYLNLRGFTPDPPIRPIEGLGLLLRALGVPAERVPADIDEASAAYRSLLADRQILVLLDNAYNVHQVRPLLPGGAACAVVITSRHRLGGLTAVEGAHRLVLDPLPTDEAAALLRVILGGARVDAEPTATRQLIKVCDHLPLALRVAAANLGEDGATIGEHVSRLRSGRLTAFSVDGDPHATVRAALDVSYLRLPPDARRLFALLSISPAGDVGVGPVAALAGRTLDGARRLIGCLTEAHLLDEQRPGRYTMHDLVRIYAGERLDDDQATGDRRAAAQRLVRWYLAVAEVVCRLGTPHRERPVPSEEPALDQGLVPDRLEDALAVLDEERPGLSAVAKLALDRGDHRSASQLAYLLAAYFQLRGDGPDSVAIYEQGLVGAQRTGDQSATTSLHNSLGIGFAVQRRWANARDHLLQARDASRRLGDRDGEARALLNLGRTLTDQGQLDEALVVFHRSLELSVAGGQHRRVAHLWNNIGLVYLHRGELDSAIEHLTHSLKLFRQRDDRNGEGSALDTLGRVHAALGDHATALRHFQDALAAQRESGNQEAEGDTLTNIGIAYQQRGDLATAVDYLESAARRHRDLGDAHKESVIHRHLAQAHLAGGNRNSALSELDIARELRARTPDAVEEAALQRVLDEAGGPTPLLRARRTATLPADA
ncbi:MAG TPA: tetratricopeptide repeat protein [Candidatus Limnocylindrales bacterium]